MQKPVNSLVSFRGLLEKELTRREFLLYLGVVALTLTGISSFLKTIKHVNPSNQKPKSQLTFGSGAYGGIRKEGM